MGGEPNDDPDRTPPAPPAVTEEAVRDSERVTTVPPPPSIDPLENLKDTAQVRAFRMPDEEVAGDAETTEVPHLASMPVKITVQPGDTVSSRPTVRPAEAQAAESEGDGPPVDDDPLSEGWKPPSKAP